MTWEDINNALLPGGFFRNDVHRDIVDATEARQIIESAANKMVDFDFYGNHLGVRRFVTLIDDDHGRFMHLLSIAEAAVPVRDRAAHISELTQVLTEARATLKTQITSESALGTDSHAAPMARVG